MQGQRPANSLTITIIAAVAIVIVVAVSAAFMYLVTTFLFAFSGSQYRMVPVVGYAALAVVGVTLAIAAVVWRLRSLAAALKWVSIATGVCWAIALIVEWILSFSFGAS
jgi:hypothetical protein